MMAKPILIPCVVIGLLTLSVGSFAAQEYIIPDVYSLTINAKHTGDINLPDKINISAINPDDRLYLFPYYISLELPAENFTAWGVQLYTNNNSDGMFTDPDGVYGGLRGNMNPQRKIPLYWQVYDRDLKTAETWGSPQSITATTLAFYPETLNRWGRIQDRRDDAYTSAWMNSVTLGRRTLAGYQGLGPYPQTGRPFVKPPVYLYLGMDLRDSAQIPSQEYSTVLHVDMFNLGVDITGGGYATPNPFTPATGQRTHFNFFLRNITSGFSIKIYTLRGRLIRTITTTRDWDGRNESGQFVEGGLYIYQIEAEGKRVSGTVVVIK